MHKVNVLRIKRKCLLRADAWYARSKARIERMLGRFWNGKRFVGYAPDGTVLDSESLLFFRPSGV